MAEISPYENEQHSVYYTDPNLKANTVRSTSLVLSDSSLPVSNTSLQGKEMKRVFNILRTRLQEKEDSIMGMLESNENTGELEKIQQLQQLHASKASLKESMRSPMLDSGLKLALDNIQNQIEKLEKQLNITKYFEWNLSECERAIDNVCLLVEHGNLINSYRRKKHLLWQGVTSGSERTQVLSASGMAVQPYTDDIYVGDPGNNRIQIYNREGKHLSCLRLEKDFYMFHLEFFGESLILLGTLGRAFHIVKINPTDGQVIRGTLCNLDHIEFNDQDKPDSHIVFSLHKSILSIQVCIYLPNHLILIQAFSFETCEPIKNRDFNVLVHLKSPHIEDSTQAVRLNAVGESLDNMQFHVLYQNSPFALQTFNLKGDLTRAIIASNVIAPTPMLSQFILDKDGNVIFCKVRHVTKLNRKTELMELADIVYSFYVFSDFGKLQHKWMYKSSKSSSLIKACIPKRFQKSPQPTFPRLPLAEYHDSRQLFTSLNSNQDIVVLHSAEPTFLLRAF